ncbi:hypothetical protein G4G27_14010 [Sphingomonas sp. So64.6b]|uniref:hypothetical protein n=1 Tax=Sphingomonas sp. So64.6b TaxID=2997354 RepID=UPI00160022BD|nr:hypothetical protein [Sphingomonas sp. So64.6b]QNA84986.1 hypothetical protein G4G27_14010 [Sphingomonas sp. So64.6b]
MPFSIDQADQVQPQHSFDGGSGATCGNPAVNLPLPDFTAESLARVIGPDTSRPIYIYCNNNFRNNFAPVVTKSRPLALNIQTFVNLVGYGYKQVWELGEAVDMNDPAIGWVES